MVKKHILLILTGLAFSLIHVGQDRLPRFEEVVRKFHIKYTHDPENPGHFLRFQKKKQGWFASIIDWSDNEKTIQSRLFWDIKDRKYKSLEPLFSEADTSKTEEKIRDYITGNNYNRYYYERCRYFGYDGWEKDIIKEFRNKNNLTDTMLEGLARAYSSYARGYLSYQYQSTTEKDPLRKQLGRLEKPGKPRLVAAKKYYDSAIAIYKKLALKYPLYETLVGNAAMKHYNEQMNTYMLFALCFDKINASKILSNIEPDTTIKAIARNWLGDCQPNAILFTFGDNDTFPLWYMQQKFNYRNDVAVINLNLLHLGLWIDYIRRKENVLFISTEELYGNQAFDFLLPEDSISDKQQNLADFIRQLQIKAAQTAPAIDEGTIRYGNNSFIIPIDLRNFSSVENQNELTDKIEISVGNYITLSDIIKFDIISANINKRPIYFSSNDEHFAKSLQAEGLIYRLLPFKPGVVQPSKTSIRKVENFLDNKFIPILKVKPLSKITLGFEDGIFPVYLLVTKNHLDSGNTQAAKEWALKTYILFQKSEIPVHSTAIDLASILFAVGEKEKGLDILNRSVVTLLDAYHKPSAIKMAVDKRFGAYYINLVIEQLDSNNLTSKIVTEAAKKFAAD